MTDAIFADIAFIALAFLGFAAAALYALLAERG
jgi:hypothetical protein